MALLSRAASLFQSLFLRATTFFKTKIMALMSHISSPFLVARHVVTFQVPFLSAPLLFLQAPWQESAHIIKQKLQLKS